MILRFTYSDGKTVDCEVDPSSTVTVDGPARGGGPNPSIIQGRATPVVPIREVASSGTVPQFRTLTAVTVA